MKEKSPDSRTKEELLQSIEEEIKKIPKPKELQEILTRTLDEASGDAWKISEEKIEQAAKFARQYLDIAEHNTDPDFEVDQRLVVFCQDIIKIAENTIEAKK